VVASCDAVVVGGRRGREETSGTKAKRKGSKWQFGVNCVFHYPQPVVVKAVWAHLFHLLLWLQLL